MGEYAGKSSVYMVKTADRNAGIRQLLGQFQLSALGGKSVMIKANFNSADPFPATTHPDTLAALVDVLRGHGAADVGLAERSGMGDTADVLRDMGVMELARMKGFGVTVLDDLDDMESWVRQGTKGFHWKHGYLFPKLFRDAGAIVQACCLKSHRFGGHFTMSLKNSIGMVARYDPDNGYDYMGELHSSPHQREMIAEVNASYAPAFVVMDAIQGFSRAGPEQGTLIEPGALLASADRVALDACGVAILRIYGTTPEVARGDVFRLPQLARAAQLGLGASGPDHVEVVPLNEGAQEICRDVERQLRGTTVARL